MQRFHLWRFESGKAESGDAQQLLEELAHDGLLVPDINVALTDDDGCIVGRERIVKEHPHCISREGCGGAHLVTIHRG